MRGNGSTDQGEGKMGKHRSRVPTREKFRRKKVPTGKSSDRKKFRRKKFRPEKFRPEKFRPEKFRSGKSSDQEKVPTRKKVPTGKKFRPGRKGKMQSSEPRTRAIYSNIDKIENNSDSNKGNSNRKE